MSTVAKQGSGAGWSGFFPELFRFGLYKPNQGRVVRQVTFISVALIALLAGVELVRSGWLSRMTGGDYSGYVGGLVIAAIGSWLAYRLVNYSLFADFLIAVEAEMNKVSWPPRRELWNASLVVMFVIFAMAASLFLFDIIWTRIFELIGIRYSGG